MVFNLQEFMDYLEDEIENEKRHAQQYRSGSYNKGHCDGMVFALIRAQDKIKNTQKTCRGPKPCTNQTQSQA